MILKKNVIVFLFFLYLSLIIGFYFGEDSLGGAFNDFESHSHIAERFRDNFIYTLLNYDDLGHRHSPIFYILKSFVLALGETNQKIFFLHLYLLIPFFFYKSLRIIYFKSDKNNLILLSTVLLLFPTFRSYSIWPDPHLLGTLFFIISIYFYSKFLTKKKFFKNAILNTIFLALSAYISPNFGVFVIFFIYEFYIKFKFTNRFIILLIINLLISLPFFFYLFYFDVSFISNVGSWDIGENILSLKNISNKFIIIISLLLFYLLPFFFSKTIKYNLININYKKNFFYFLIFLLAIFFFDFSYSYNLTNSGGGFFYNLSQLLFKNNALFFILCLFAFVYLVEIFKIDKRNILIFVTLILSNPQNTLWQANFSPTIYFSILLLFNLNLKEDSITKNTIYYNYAYFLLYLVSALTYKLILN